MGKPVGKRWGCQSCCLYPNKSNQRESFKKCRSLTCKPILTSIYELPNKYKSIRKLAKNSFIE